jgi:hypothetical protein
VRERPTCRQPRPPLPSHTATTGRPSKTNTASATAIRSGASFNGSKCPRVSIDIVLVIDSYRRRPQWRSHKALSREYAASNLLVELSALAFHTSRRRLSYGRPLPPIAATPLRAAPATPCGPRPGGASSLIPAGRSTTPEGARPALARPAGRDELSSCLRLPRGVPANRSARRRARDIAGQCPALWDARQPRPAVRCRPGPIARFWALPPTRKGSSPAPRGCVEKSPDSGQGEASRGRAQECGHQGPGSHADGCPEGPCETDSRAAERGEPEGGGHPPAKPRSKEERRRHSGLVIGLRKVPEERPDVAISRGVFSAFREFRTAPQKTFYGKIG